MLWIFHHNKNSWNVNIWHKTAIDKVTFYQVMCAWGNVKASQRNANWGSDKNILTPHWALLESPHFTPADSPSENKFLLMTVLQSSSSSRRATRESVWLLVAPTKSAAKLWQWNPRGWRPCGKEKGTAWFSDPSWGLWGCESEASSLNSHMEKKSTWTSLGWHKYGNALWHFYSFAVQNITTLQLYFPMRRCSLWRLCDGVATIGNWLTCHPLTYPWFVPHSFRMQRCLCTGSFM